MRRATFGFLLVALGLCACNEADFAKPTDVAFLSNGDLIVADGYDNARIVRFGAGPTEWGEAGCEDGEFDIPHGITVDADDHVYVADRGNARVQVFDADGVLITTWGTSLVGRPWGLEHHDGHVYVIDGGDQDPDHPAGRVVVMTLEGKRAGGFGGPGDGTGEFTDAHDIAVDQEGAVYVAEIGGRRVQKFVPVQ